MKLNCKEGYLGDIQDANREGAWVYEHSNLQQTSKNLRQS